MQAGSETEKVEYTTCGYQGTQPYPPAGWCRCKPGELLKEGFRVFRQKVSSGEKRILVFVEITAIQHQVGCEVPDDPFSDIDFCNPASSDLPSEKNDGFKIKPKRSAKKRFKKASLRLLYILMDTIDSSDLSEEALKRFQKAIQRYDEWTTARLGSKVEAMPVVDVETFRIIVPAGHRIIHSLQDTSFPTLKLGDRIFVKCERCKNNEFAINNKGQIIYWEKVIANKHAGQIVVTRPIEYAVAV